MKKQDLMIIDLLDKNARKIIKSAIVEQKNDDEIFKIDRCILKVIFYINPTTAKPKKMVQLTACDINMKKEGRNVLVDGVFETVLNKEYITSDYLHSGKSKKVKVLDKNLIMLTKR